MNKYFHLIYFVSVRAYERGNKTSVAAFFAVTGWFSLLQIIWLMMLLAILELLGLLNLGHGNKNMNLLYYSGAIIFTLNAFYIFVLRKSKTIREEFSELSEKKQKRYWLYVCILFFTSLVLSAIAGNLVQKYSPFLI